MASAFTAVKAAVPAQNSYRQGIDEKVAGNFRQYESGQYSPFIIAIDSTPVYLLFGAIFILHYFPRSIVRYVRFAFFALLVVSSLWIITHVRTLGLAYGYGVGLSFTVGIMQSSALLICHDSSTDFNRLEQRVNASTAEDTSVTGISSGATALPAPGTVFKRVNANGEAGRPSTIAESDGTRGQSTRFLFQGYPSSFWHRWDWTFDLMTSLRGAGWNWRLRTLGPLSQDESSGCPKRASDDAKRQFHLHQVKLFLIYYLTLDLGKVIMMYDPYFVGVAPLSAPAPEPLATLLPILTNPTILRSYRLIVACIGVIVALNLVFTIGPLFYGFVLPHILPFPHYTPLSEPCLYPPQQNSFTYVLDQGLAGWWGQFWHQMFRFSASEPSKLIIEKMGWNPRSTKSRILQVMIAFTITATAHYAGSYTMYDHSLPWQPFFFFILQGVGILAQTFITKSLGTNRLPRWLRRTGNLVTVAVWAYYTGPLFADDLSRSGLWNFEPVPISPLRGLGLGLKGEGWWCWHGKWVIWWDGRPGDPWWRKGWAII